MAEYTEYGRKVVDGVEVYEVGKLQLWGWTGWTRRGFDCAQSYGNEPIMCSAESLAKGKYVVLESTAEFGRMHKLLWCVASYGSLKKAVAAVKDYQEYDAYKLGIERSLGGNVLCHGYEIWHVVDDAALWQVWEHDAAQSLQYDTDYHVYDGQRCVLSLTSPEEIGVYVLDDYDNFIDAPDVHVAYLTVPEL